jgi:hypothetical protein
MAAEDTAGASLKVVAPTVNMTRRNSSIGRQPLGLQTGTGLFSTLGHLLLDGYMGAWLYTTNPKFLSRNAFFPGTRAQSLNPVGSFAGHVSTVSSLGSGSLSTSITGSTATSVNRVQNPLTIQTNSRIGGTVSIPISKHQSLKVSYADGAYIRYGGNYQRFLCWLGRPK